MKRKSIILLFFYLLVNSFFGCATGLLTADIVNNYQPVWEVNHAPRKIEGRIVNEVTKDGEQYLIVTAPDLLFESQEKRYISILIPKNLKPIHNEEENPIEIVQPSAMIYDSKNLPKTKFKSDWKKDRIPREEKPAMLLETEQPDLKNGKKVIIIFDKCIVLGRSGKNSEKYIRFVFLPQLKRPSPPLNVDLITNIIDGDRRFKLVCDDNIKWIKRNHKYYVLKYFNYIWTVPLDVATLPLQIIIFAIIKIG